MVDLPLSAKIEIKIDVSDCNSFKALHTPFERLSLQDLEFLKFKVYLGTNEFSLKIL